jgi:hypothetical protein
MKEAGLFDGISDGIVSTASRQYSQISGLDRKRYRQGGEGEKFRMRVIVLGGAGNFGARR